MIYSVIRLKKQSFIYALKVTNLINVKFVLEK